MTGFGLQPFGTSSFGGVSSSLPGVPFLTEQLGPDARIIVEVAWGADVNAAYATWTWTDITTDVQIKNGINLKHGRGDEASFVQPATCSLVLGNTTGAYSRGGKSSNWPNVRKNTPVRVLVDDDGDGTFAVLFIGYADSWQPMWNKAATVAEVHLTASGILRRLAQHTAPVQSSLRRRLGTETNVVAYWPLEEGKLATSGRSAIEGHPDLIVIGTVDFAGDTETFASTAQMPVLKNGGFTSTVPTYTFTPTVGQQFRCLVSFPENGTGMVNNGVIARLYLAHATLNRVDILYGTGGVLTVQAFQQSGVASVSRMSSSVAFDADGQDVRLYFELKQVGANVTYNLGIQRPGGMAGAAGGTVAGGAATLGVITAVEIGSGINLSGMAVGHVTIQNTITSIFTDAKELDAFEGEVSHTRYTRLAGENGLESTVIGDGTVFDRITDKMGEQRPQPLYQLLQQIQAVDQGVIHDGRVQGGLVFATRRLIETQTPDMVIDVGAGDLAEALMPSDDDQGLLNKAAVTRQDGATAVYEDITGPLGTATVGTYDSSLTIPVASDAAAVQYASWLVALGTVEGYRYPSIELDLAARPNLIPSMRALHPGARVDLVNVTGVATQHPGEDIRLIVQGYEQTITPFSWRATLTCTPFAPWGVGAVTNTDGTPVAPRTDAESLHVDTAGSQIASSASAGATSLSVATTSGPLWTTSAQDLPFPLEVAGIVVTVTAIAGTSSPQTFTVTGVTKALTAGQPVQMHAPQTLGL